MYQLTIQNFSNAVKYHKKAIEDGDYSSASMFAKLYLRGHGVVPSIDKAIEMYKLAYEKVDDKLAAEWLRENGIIR